MALGPAFHRRNGRHAHSNLRIHGLGLHAFHDEAAAYAKEHARMAEEICRTISLRDLEARLG